MDEIREVKARHEGEWLSLEEVVAVGIGRTEDRGTGIIVSIREGNGGLRGRIPREVDGVPVELRETGDIRPL